MHWVRLFVASLLLAACSGSSTPATTPSSVATTSSTTTTTTLEVTTTLDRIAEIEAIYQDLEERRLDALYRRDEEAFRALFANDEYLGESLGILEQTTFVAAPSSFVLEVREVLVDDASCLAALVFRDLRSTFGEEAVGERIVVLEKSSEVWGYSFIGDGWLCEGPHPFS